MQHRIGIVLIGRNEGERLRTSLRALPVAKCPVVYVDSGSSDGSLAWAVAFGARGVALDMSRPFTAGRARNEGVRALLAMAPDVEFIQFLDGDCELHPQWLGTAAAFLQEHPDQAVVCGRLRERHPQRSVFNRLCDWEWDTPVGDAKACGGNAMMRRSAFTAEGGFRDDLIAGEEPELCVRLRAAGWRIHRLAAEMALHDAAMTRFSQWWRRTQRCGYAFAEGAWLHGRDSERHWVRETARAVLYGGVLPFAIALLAVAHSPWWLLLALVYPVQVLRLAMRPGGWTRAFYLVLGRFPEFLGALVFLRTKLSQGPARIMEYK
jgi:GT2 family glycosyltransferase